MPEAMIFDAMRTPRGKGSARGALYPVKPVSLVVALLRELEKRAPGLDPSGIDDVILGVGSPVGDQGADIARTAALVAGLPETVAGLQVGRFCASGLEAVNTAAQKIMSGWDDLVVAGGIECLSRVPMGADGGAWSQDPETSWDTYFIPQGVAADLMATLDGVSRSDVDNFALESHRRAEIAWQAGHFDGSIVPVSDRNGACILECDELLRAGTTTEGLSLLSPSFAALGRLGFADVALQKYRTVEAIEHVHTAGNSSGLADGAALVLVGGREVGERYGLTPRARVVSTAIIGGDPTLMLGAPGAASRKALASAGMSVDDIDLFEVNEAFASVVLRFMHELDVGHDVVNVNGGAIAMGHPVGATGAMLLGTLLDELERQDLQRGLVTLCAGGGIGIATIIERV